MRNNGQPSTQTVVPEFRKASLSETSDHIGRQTNELALRDVDRGVADLRALAREGRLAETYRSASPEMRVQLSGAAYAVAWPVVFSRVTRVQEQRRGHWTCAIALHRMADDCLDRFYDDMEAVVTYVLTRATVCIQGLEGWIASVAKAATVDGFRRRRGARGAVQRPRLPGWLADGLGRDPWLGRLALEILGWVGIPMTAGTSLWPLNSWAARRAEITGDLDHSDQRLVAREVDHVLLVMRSRPQWYADHIERPLGAKTPPVAPVLAESHASEPEPVGLPLVEPHELLDAWLTELASVALTVIAERLQVSADRPAMIATVVEDIFGEIDLSRTITDLPHAAGAQDEWVATLLSDPAEIDRVVGVVLDILKNPDLTEHLRTKPRGPQFQLLGDHLGSDPSRNQIASDPRQFTTDGLKDEPLLLSGESRRGTA